MSQRTDRSNNSQGQNGEGPEGQSRSSGWQRITEGFDLEGEVRSWAKQYLAHMQLLLAHVIATPPPLSIQCDEVWSREAKSKERTNSVNLRIKTTVFSFLLIIAME